jgi:hypothetical protein
VSQGASLTVLSVAEALAIDPNESLSFAAKPAFGARPVDMADMLVHSRECGVRNPGEPQPTFRQ